VCLFQTPASLALCSSWKKARWGILSCIAHSKKALSWTHRMWNHRQSLPTTIPLESVLAQQPEPSLRPKDLSIIHQTTNTSDARCVSWILRNIADPEALDAAVQLAGVIRWFDDGINVGLPCDLSFRCLGLQRLCISPRLNHTKNYRELVDIVFGSPESEAIAVLLLAWTTTGYSFHPQALLGICTAHLVDPPPGYRSPQGCGVFLCALSNSSFIRDSRGWGGEIYRTAKPSPCHNRGYG